MSDLIKEDYMPVGAIQIIPNALASSAVQGAYLVFFVPYGRREASQLHLRRVSGLDSLKEFLAQVGTPQGKLEEALSEVSQAMTASIENITLSNEQLQVFNQP